MMMDEQRQVVTAVLSNGVELAVDVLGDGGVQNIGSLSERLDLHGVRDTLTGLAIMVKDALERVRPETASVEFGLDINVETPAPLDV